MSTVIRGVRNAFRNTIRTTGVAIILGLSIGLALVMFLSLKTVQSRIQTVKSSIGNTITISPAGMRGVDGGGEPLTQSQIDTVKSLAHVTGVTGTLIDRLTPTADTSLTSAIEAGTLGRRFQQRGDNTEAPPAAIGGSGTSSSSQSAPILPVPVTGVTEVSASILGVTSLKFTAGQAIDASSSANVANVGTELATKNNLSVGSTFTAYDGTTITVVGIFDAGNKFSNTGLVMPLATVQKLSGQTGELSSVTVTVDDITNVDATLTAIQDKLGDNADVVSQKDRAETAVEPLENIKSIALYSLIGSLVAGSVIIFLTMMMIVRERRREIGVLKAIGASNIKIVLQFIGESLALTSLGAVLGIIGGFLLANPVLNMLVTSSANSTETSGPVRGMMGPGGPMSGSFKAVGQTLQNLTTAVGLDTLLYGLAAAILIAVIGSALPAWFIAKIRPAEVMRGE